MLFQVPARAKTLSLEFYVVRAHKDVFVPSGNFVYQVADLANWVQKTDLIDIFELATTLC